MFWGEYSDGPNLPLFAFGHGLTYTTFEYGALEVIDPGSTCDPVDLRIAITNVGARRGSDVVQLYVRDEVASVARPSQQLVGFSRVDLERGASASVAFRVDPSRLAFYDESMRFVVEPGLFRFSAGNSSAGATSDVQVDLAGETEPYLQREVVATTVSVTYSPGPPSL
jgi:beta-glucosidase